MSGPCVCRFRPADDLRARFTALGARPEGRDDYHCQGGIRAAHTILALTITGFASARTYAGSRAE